MNVSFMDILTYTNYYLKKTLILKKTKCNKNSRTIILFKKIIIIKRGLVDQFISSFKFRIS